METARFLGCGQDLVDEWFGATRAALVADAAEANAQIIVAAHPANLREVRELLLIQDVGRTGGLSCEAAPRAKSLIWQRSSTDRPRRSLRLLSCLSNRAVIVNLLFTVIDTSPLYPNMRSNLLRRATASALDGGPCISTGSAEAGTMLARDELRCAKQSLGFRQAGPAR